MNTRQTYTYKQIDQMTLELYDKIKSDFKPDVIIGVSRGGLLPAVILSHKFNVPLRVINVSLRDFESSDSYDFTTDFENILFVDDIADTGSTYHQIAEPYILNGTYIDIRFSTLFVREHTNSFNVNYYAESIIDDTWIVFPWEHDED